MKLKLELDVDTADFLFGGLAEVLRCIGDTVQDEGEAVAHLFHRIRGKDGKEIGWWEVS